MNLKESTIRIIQYPDASNELEPYLRGRWLMFARIGWIVVAILAVILNIAGTPLEYQVYQTTTNTVCNCSQFTSQQAAQLKNLGISLSFYAGTLVASQLLFVAVWFAVAIVLFFYLFPTGRFVPRWTRILGMAWVLCSLIWIIEMPDSPPFVSQVDSIYCNIYYVLLGVGLIAQLYRYLRVSNLVQRQQTKWVIYSFTLSIGGFLTLNIIGNLRFVIPSLMQFTEGPLGNFLCNC